MDYQAQQEGNIFFCRETGEVLLPRDRETEERGLENLKGKKITGNSHA